MNYTMMHGSTNIERKCPYGRRERRVEDDIKGDMKGRA
jgi:hypothetical protein